MVLSETDGVCDKTALLKRTRDDEQSLDGSEDIIPVIKTARKDESSDHIEPTAQISFSNKVMLAPMVRIGTLPMRLLALHYGADLVYSEEMVDKKMIGSTRVENNVLGTIDYVKNDKLVFRTHPDEKDKLIFQMGTADAELALQVARLVADDVAAIDVNCGCPKWFSIQGGMGAALLKNPDNLEKILKTLVEGSAKPVTCKIRISTNLEETIALCKRLEKTGIRAIGVHARTVDERPKDSAHWDAFKPIVEAVSIPIILNGDIFSQEDIQKVKTLSSGKSVMLARAARYNPSVFRSEGLIPIEDVAKEYVKKVIDCDYIYQNCKYVLMAMHVEQKTGINPKIQKAKSLRDLSVIFGLEEYYDEKMKRYASLEITRMNDNPSYDDHFPYVPR